MGLGPEHGAGGTPESLKRQLLLTLRTGGAPALG